MSGYRVKLLISRNRASSFGPSVDAKIRTSITDLLGVFSPVDTSRYLALPSLIGRSKKSIFGFS